MDDYENLKEQIKEDLLNALRNTSAHTKQWYVEQALLKLVGTATFNTAYDEKQWVEGIPPR